MRPRGELPPARAGSDRVRGPRFVPPFRLSPREVRRPISALVNLRATVLRGRNGRKPGRRLGRIGGWMRSFVLWYNRRWRGVRVVDGAALEKRSGDEPAWVRIPPSPPGDATSSLRALGRVA